MAKTLIIKNANFATNALDKVSFNVVPCTGIVLDKNTEEIVNLGNVATLVATVTPSDTTDEITWSSSDDSVASVNNGVVTATGLGVAVITVSCGNFSATCAVNSRVFMDKSTYLLSVYLGGETTFSGGNGLPTLSYSGDLGNRCSVVFPTGTLHFYREVDGVMYYPYPIPQNAKRIKITTPISDKNVRTDSLQLLSLGQSASGFPEVAQLVDKISYGDLKPVNGVAVVNIPQHEGFPTIDAIAIMFKTTTSDTVFDASDLAACSVEFLLEE